MAELIIHDGNADQFLTHTIQDAHTGIGYLLGRGYKPRDYAKSPLGSYAAAPTYDVDIIPRSEWSQRIADMVNSGSQTSDLIRQSGIPPLNQQQTEFCWCNAPVNACRVIRVLMGEPFVNLSPASVACPITGYRNQGGMGIDSTQYIADNGICNVTLWPANAISRQYNTPAATADRANHRFTKWGDVDTSSNAFDKLVSLLLQRRICPVGYNFWQHEVLAVDPVEITPGKYGVRIWNSWGEWQDHGFAVLNESKGRPDDCQVCLASTISPI